MSQPTVNDVQAVDPVLTNMVVAYMQAQSRFVASRVFPAVMVDKDSGTYYVFTKKYWLTDEMKQRAPATKYPRAGYGISTATYVALQWALAHPIADEVRRNSQVPMDLEQAGIQFLGQKSLIRKERAFVADFMKTGVWGTTDDNSATDWDDFSAGDPLTNIKTAKRTISQATGVAANTMVVGQIVDDALTAHPDIIDRIVYTARGDEATVRSALAGILGIENYLVSEASYNSANEGQDASMAAIVDDDALICHVTPTPGIFVPSAGYTFAWAPGGGMGGLTKWRDEEADADLLKYKEQWDQKAVATDCGYIFLDIV